MLRIKQITRPGLEPPAGNAGQTALSENGGHPGGQFGEDSNSVAILREQAVADFQRCWRTLERLEAAALPTDATTVQNLREGLALLMNQLAALLMNQLAALMTDSE